MTVQSGFVPEVKEGPCTDTYVVVDTDYPTKKVYVTREVYEPAAPAYYTVIPSAHCSKGGSDKNRYVTAPVHANPDGTPLQLPEIHTSKDVQTGVIKGDPVTVYADLAIKEGLSYEEYLKAIEQLQAIESGTHHVGDVMGTGSSSLITATASTASSDTFFMEKTTIDQPGGAAHPLVVDIEKELRATPIDGNGKKFTPPDTPAGFVPLGGDKGISPTASLPEDDSTRLNDAADKATNEDWKKLNPNPDPSKPIGDNIARDQINKYFTPKGGPFKPTGNADRAAVTNDAVLVHPSTGSTDPNEFDTMPREFIPK